MGDPRKKGWVNPIEKKLKWIYSKDPDKAKEMIDLMHNNTAFRKALIKELLID